MPPQDLTDDGAPAPAIEPAVALSEAPAALLPEGLEAQELPALRTALPPEGRARLLRRRVRAAVAGARELAHRVLDGGSRVPLPILVALVLAGPVTVTSLVLVAVSSRSGGVATEPTIDLSPLVDGGATDAGASDGSADGPDNDASVVLGPVRAPLWRVGALASDPAIVVTEAALGHRPLSLALAAAGVPRLEVSRLVASFSSLRTFDRCSPRDSFAVAREKATGRLVAFEFASSPFDVWQARRTDDGRFESKKLALRFDRLPVTIGLLVHDDLRTSLAAAGLDDDMVGMLDDALHGHVELASVRPGARLRVIALEDRVDGAFGRYAELEAVEYVPVTGAPLRLYHYGGPITAPLTGASHGAAAAHTHTMGNGGYYDAKGRQPFAGGWRSPVPLARISSRFNLRRVHPLLHVVMPHTGVDYAAAPGTPVYSTAPGMVTSAGDGGPCGRMVQILHSNGLTSAYCHLSRFAAGLRGGLRIEGRQLVGYVGQTGRATGPHLHFAVKRGEAFLDPLALRLDGVRVVPPEGREEFARHRVELDGRLDAIVLPALPAGMVGSSTGDGGAEDGGDLGDAAGEPQEVIYDQPP